jgi:hypothetical protein
MTKVWLLFFAITVTSATAATEDFLGEWRIHPTPKSKRDAFFLDDIKYPKWMKIELRNGKLVGVYEDQSEFRSEFELVAVINRGRDLIFVHGGLGTKEPESFCPVHHAKLVNGKLEGVVTANGKLFEWIGERVTD